MLQIDTNFLLRLGFFQLDHGTCGVPSEDYQQRSSLSDRPAKHHAVITTSRARRHVVEGSWSCRTSRKITSKSWDGTLVTILLLSGLTWRWIIGKDSAICHEQTAPFVQSAFFRFEVVQCSWTNKVLYFRYMFNVFSSAKSAPLLPDLHLSYMMQCIHQS